MVWKKLMKQAPVIVVSAAYWGEGVGGYWETYGLIPLKNKDFLVSSNAEFIQMTIMVEHGWGTSLAMVQTLFCQWAFLITCL